jgi:hypothetical protein
MYQAENRWTLLAYCAAILALAGTVFLTRLPGTFRFTAVAPYAAITLFIHSMTPPFEGVPLRTAIPEPAARMLNAADPCHVYFDAGNAGRLRLHQYFRIQYHFPHCSIELVPVHEPLPAGSLLLERRARAGCGQRVRCHDLHPDLVLHRGGRD